MLFNSLSYGIFLPIVFLLYWKLAHRYRWVLLFFASYYFYMSWNPKYVVLILGTTLISYFAAIYIEKAGTKKQKNRILAGAAIVCLGVLFLFKYFNFASGAFVDFLGIFSIKLNPITLKLLLPVGISFYTFQTLSYVIDVYKGEIKAEKHLGYYATFISFFPQLVAGPIERTSNLLPQIRKKKRFDEEMAFTGAKIMLWGFFKKMVVADMVSKYVDTTFAGLDHMKSGFTLLLAAFFFTIQIYCDFSGYSSIAIGSAKLLGINLMDNFKSPYLATSIREFWGRWHISLSTWFRDYLYIPLGGNRCSKRRNYLNIFITFLVSGAWHGANWTFIFWGMIHGIGQILENVFAVPIKRLKDKKIGVFISWVFVFAFCNIAWIFFRADSIGQAFYFIAHIFDGILSPAFYIKEGFNALTITKIRLMYIAVMIFILFMVDLLNKNGNLINRISKMNKYVQWVIFMGLALIVILFAQKGEAAEFVYFQF